MTLGQKSKRENTQPKKKKKKKGGGGGGGRGVACRKISKEIFPNRKLLYAVCTLPELQKRPDDAPGCTR